MTDEREEDVAPEEADAPTGAELPDRVALSTIDANVAIPADPTIAAKVLADDPFGETGVETDEEVTSDEDEP